MTVGRMGQIALKVIVAKCAKEGIHTTGRSLHRALEPLARDTNIPVGELERFAKGVVARASAVL